MAKYTTADIEKRFQDMTACARIKIRFVSPFVGGQPGDRDGVTAFVMHHLGLKEPLVNDAGEPVFKRGKQVWRPNHDGVNAIERILGQEVHSGPALEHNKEVAKSEEEVNEREEEVAKGKEIFEVGEKDITPPEGEYAEKLSFAVNCLRWSPQGHGPYIGDWMIKANLKQALSRLGLFQKKKGSKGDVAEVGRAIAIGESLKGDNPRLIHINLPGGEKWEDRIWDRIFGRVHTPQGAKSIVTDCELAPVGCTAEFEFRWYAGKILEDDFANALAVSCNCGLGSARSLERGKFEIVEAEIIDKKPKARGETKEKKAKPAAKSAAGTAA